MNPSGPPKAPKGSSFATENKGAEKSHAGVESIESKEGFWGSRLVKSIKSVARYIAGGLRAAFRNIRSFLVTDRSPSDSSCRKRNGAFSGQDSRKGADRRVLHRRRVDPADAHGARRAAMSMHGMMSDIAAPVVLVYNADLKQCVEYLEVANRGAKNEFFYGVASPVDKAGQLQDGIARLVKDLASDRHDQAVLKRQDDQQPGSMEYGMIDLRPMKEETGQSSGRNRWRGVYGMRLPPASDPEFFDNKLKEAILDVLRTADQNGVSRLVLPFPVGDKEGAGTGRRLAKVLYEALHAFRCSSDNTPPEVFLVGMGKEDVITEGCQLDEQFQEQWFACERAGMYRQEFGAQESSDASDAGTRVVSDAARTATETATGAGTEASSGTTTEASSEASTEAATEQEASTEASTKAATEASTKAATRANQDDDQSG